MATLRFRYARSIREIDERAWDALGPAHLCTRYAWLRALEESGSIGPERGIAFRIPLLLNAAGTIVAAAPGVIKGHTLGEYGPESEWIRRAQKSGKPLLPKLQIEVPMTPIAGPRLLTHPAWSRTELADALLKAILQATEAGQQNALTLARMTAEEAELAPKRGMVISYEMGSASRNEGYANYAEFLSRLKHSARYDIRKECSDFARLGLEVRVLRGDRILAWHWDALYSGYAAVCERKRAPRLMARDFFDRIAPLGDKVMLIAAFSGDAFKAAVLALHSGEWLLSRIWGEIEPIPNAAFELGLYRPAEMAIELGLHGVDGGVWGGHKAKRGFRAIAHPKCALVPGSCGADAGGRDSASPPSRLPRCGDAFVERPLPARRIGRDRVSRTVVAGGSHAPSILLVGLFVLESETAAREVARQQKVGAGDAVWVMQSFVPGQFGMHAVLAGRGRVVAQLSAVQLRRRSIRATAPSSVVRLCRHPAMAAACAMSPSPVRPAFTAGISSSNKMAMP